eukprot:2598226-Amphidinium_carterae.1
MHELLVRSNNNDNDNNNNDRAVILAATLWRTFLQPMVKHCTCSIVFLNADKGANGTSDACVEPLQLVAQSRKAEVVVERYS